MRKTIQYILLFLFIWQIVGFVGYFEFSHFKLKKEIKLLLKQGVPENELVFFDFTDKEMSELIWLKKNEFNLNGNLFDVVRKSKSSDGKNHLECISDKKETILFARLNQTISQNLGEQKNPTPISNWMKLLKLPLSIQSFYEEPVLVHYDLEDFNEFFYLNHYSHLSNESLSPPPQIS